MLLKILLAVLAVTAGLYDLRYRQIPNWLVLAGLAGGLAGNVVEQGLGGLWTSLTGFGLALLIYVPLYLLRGAGGGDLKLMSAIGAMVGAQEWLLIFVLSALFGGLAALLLLLARGKLVRAIKNIFFILNELAHFRPPHASRPELDISHPEALTLPHAAVIALGCLAYLCLGRLLPSGGL